VSLTVGCYDLTWYSNTVFYVRLLDKWQVEREETNEQENKEEKEKEEDKKRDVTNERVSI